MRSTFARAAVVLFIAFAAVACSRSLDMGGLETQLENQLNTQLKTTGITVDCPTDVKAEAGGQFDCTGTLSTGQTITVHVTQTDSDGHVTWEVTGPTTGSTGASTSGPTGTT